jgi:hypothetical protein
MNKFILKKSDLIYWVFLILCFFPFLNILRIPTDSQPNVLIFSVIILLKNYKNIYLHLPAKILNFIYIFIVAFFLLLFSDKTFSSILSFTSYISLLLVPLAVFISLLKVGGLPKYLFHFIIYIWGFVAIIQRFVYRDFLNFLLYRNMGSGILGRGVNSLAPEPTYYGTILTFFIIIFFLNYKFIYNKFILFFIIFQLFFLSISATVFAVILISIFTIFFYNFIKLKFDLNKFLYSLFIISFFLLFIFTFKSSLESTRFYKIVNLLINNPELVLRDESINERLNHALFPIISLFDNYGLPHGFNHFQYYIMNKMNNNSLDFLFVNINLEHYSRIMSGYGSTFFELGLFGILIPYYLFTIFNKLLFKNEYLFIFILLNFLLFTSISFNNSIILFVLGNILFLNHNKYIIND